MPEAYVASGGDESPVEKSNMKSNQLLFVTSDVFPSLCAMLTQRYIPESEDARRLIKNGTIIEQGSGFVLLKPLKED